MLDEYLYNVSTSAQVSPQDMTDKEVLFVQDSNGGSYSGQIILETSSLANSGRFLAYSESYIEVPFVVSLKSDVDIATGNLANGFMIGLKNGHHQLIDSIQVDMGNSNVVQLQPFLNYHVSYKLNTELSPSDVKKFGSVIGFSLDNPCSASFNATGSDSSGLGTRNNVLNNSYLTADNKITGPSWRTTLDSENVNYGLLERQKLNAFSPTAGWNGNPAIALDAATNQIAKNYWTAAGAGAAAIYQFVITATIRMRDLSDFFDKIPLLRGVFLRVTINYNSVSASVVRGGDPVTITPTLTQLSGRSNPLMLTSAAYGNPNAAILGVNNTLTVSCGITKTSSPASSVSTPLSAVRWYVPAYILNPVREEQYLSMNKFKTITYRDIYNYNVLGVSAGSSFNAILTNGIVNPKKVIVIPVFNGETGNAAGSALNPAQSFFDTVPATTSPLAALTNFNVQVSGQNMFQQNENYDFQQFLDEMSRSGVNGGPFDVGVQSGLIGYTEWTYLYRYYVCDVSRRMTAENSVPKSIVISGSNACAKKLDLYCFVEFERSITVNLEDGQIVRSSI